MFHKLTKRPPFLPFPGTLYSGPFKAAPEAGAECVVTAQGPVWGFTPEGHSCLCPLSALSSLQHQLIAHADPVRLASRPPSPCCSER